MPITVPGAVRSWADAHERFGRLGRATILGPAIELATDGFAVWDDLAASIERTHDAIAEGRDGGGWANGFDVIYRPAGRTPRVGERLRLPALAGTLRQLAEEGFAEYYEGRTAGSIAAALEAAGSPIRAADLRAHRSTWGEPIAVDYRGVTYATHPPNSVGVAALQILAVLGRADGPPRAAFGPSGWTDVAWLHRGIEAAKRAFADRDLVADPEVVDVPVAEILGARRIAGIAGSIDPRRADPGPPPTRTLVGGTIYLATVDGDGNAVSLIQSNASGFGSGVVDAATGVHFQNRGQSFSLDAGHPAELGPARRPIHSLVPGMLLRDGRPWVVLGSMGGDAQIQIATQLTSAIVDGRADVATAVGAPRWFVGPDGDAGPPTAVTAEARFEAGVLEALAALGHDVRRVAPFAGDLGHAHAIELVDGGPAAGGSLAAATDPRSAGLPAAW